MTTANALYILAAMSMAFGLFLFMREYARDGRKAAITAHMEKACSDCKARSLIQVIPETEAFEAFEAFDNGISRQIIGGFKSRTRWHANTTVPMRAGWYSVRRYPSKNVHTVGVQMQWNGRQWQGTEQVCKHQEFEWFGCEDEGVTKPEHYSKADHLTVWTRIEDSTPTQKGFYEVFYTGMPVFGWFRAYWNGKSFVMRPGTPKLPTLELFWRGLDHNPEGEV